VHLLHAYHANRSVSPLCCACVDTSSPILYNGINEGDEMKYIVKGEGTPITYFCEDKAKEHAHARRERGILAYYVVEDDDYDDACVRCDSCAFPVRVARRVFGGR